MTPRKSLIAFVYIWSSFWFLARLSLRNLMLIAYIVFVIYCLGFLQTSIHSLPQAFFLNKQERHQV